MQDMAAAQLSTSAAEVAYLAAVLSDKSVNAEPYKSLNPSFPCLLHYICAELLMQICKSQIMSHVSQSSVPSTQEDKQLPNLESSSGRGCLGSTSWSLVLARVKGRGLRFAGPRGLQGGRGARPHSETSRH